MPRAGEDISEWLLEPMLKEWSANETGVHEKYGEIEMWDLSEVPAPLEEEEDDAEDVTIEVEEITINGKNYYQSDNGTIYDIDTHDDMDTHDVVGENGRLFEIEYS